MSGVVTAHLEIETKYDVDDGFVLPALDDVPGAAGADEPVEHLLDAVYQDTADLRLLKARVTLRRRTGGPDAGWHLKLPAGTARRELHAPLGRAVKRPPQALLEPVAGILRGEATGPVVVLRTRRVVTALRDREGRVLAEVADDTVTATVPAAVAGQAAEVRAWREVEVELVAGDDALAAAVGKLLVAAGARPSLSASKVGRVLAGRVTAVSGSPRPGKKGKRGPAAGDAVLDVLRGQLADLHTADVLLRTGQPGAVHRLRVAAGGLRTTLAVFSDVLQPSTPVREELAWLRGQLAGARNDEVALAHLRGLAAAEPVELLLGPVAARLQQTQIKAATTGVDGALATVSEPRYLSLLDALHALLDDPPFTARADDAFRSVHRDAFRHSAARLRRRLRTAGSAGDDERAEALHDVRTAAGRLRRVAELSRREGGAAPLVRVAEQVQRALGEVQESVVTREHCRRLGIVTASAGENSFPYGRLHALEQARGERAEARFRALEPDLRRRLRRVLR